MVFDIDSIDVVGAGLHVAQIVPLPDVQPLAHSQTGWFRVGPIVDGHGGSLHFLPDFLLRFAGERALDLFPSTWIPPGGDPGLPVDILLARAGDGLFPDRAAAFGVAS